MKYFHKIAENVNVSQLCAAIARQPQLWDQHTFRTKTKGSPHSQISDIWLMFNDIEKYSDPTQVIDDKDVEPYPGWFMLPQARPIIFDLMRYVEGVRLGRVVITKLPPGGIVPPHVDSGEPATYFTRYQLALQCRPGCVFQIMNEQVTFRDGEIWMIDNNSEHSVVNNSEDDRLVMVIDIRSET